MTSSSRHYDVILSRAKQDVPERMKNFNPSMKLIMVVCDPVKRVLSRYYHMYEDNDEIKLETFEDQVRFSLNRIQEQDYWGPLSVTSGMSVLHG